MRNRFYVFFLSLLISGGLFAQGSISGVIIDTETNEPLIGTNVILKGTSTGDITDLNGNFMIGDVPNGMQTVIVSYIGYGITEMDVDVNGATDLGTFGLMSDAIGLSEIQVLADIAIDRKTPVAVSKISAETIQDKLGSQEFPEIMKMTPSIYATKTSGGFGDARINIRGFKQEDVALLINGIPVNGMEDNKIYWSNWAGLGDVTRSIQVQRGLGASKLAVASVGGTINILTKTTDQDAGGSITTQIGNDNYRKLGLTLSTGMTDDGWAFTFSGSRTTGDGYIEGNYIDAWNYFGSVSKQINDDNLLMLTGFGSPQRHGQRSFEHSLDDQKNTYGTRWNDDYGTYQGQGFGWRENFYHKPQVGLSHIWQASVNTSLTTSVYGSVGRGGGTGDIGSLREFLIPNDSYGHENFDAIAGWNAGQSSLNAVFGPQDPIAAVDYSINGDSGNGQVASKENGGTIKRASMNEHQWFGLISNLSTDLSEQLTLSGGIDLRWYTGSHYRKAIDLIGAEYWFDDDNVNLMDDTITYINGDGEEVTESGQLVRPTNDADRLWGTVDDKDKIDYNNDENINWYGGFAQLEYTSGDFSGFLSGAVNSTSMRRIDYAGKLNSDPNQTTDWYNFLGGNVKIGANYNLDNHNNVFANVGMISRAPYFDVLFPTFDNDNPNEDVVNENVTAFELGYGYRSSSFKVNVNGYYTKWTDKSEVITDDYVLPDGTEIQDATFNLLGVDALHTGFEFDATYRVNRNIDLTGFVSVGTWEWASNPDGVVTDDDQNVIGNETYYLDGISVGDAAQTTWGLGAAYEFSPGLTIDMQYLHSDNLYAAYDTEDRSNSLYQDVQPILLPDFGLTDLGMTWGFDLFDKAAKLRFNINNLFDIEYVSEAVDRINGVEDGDGNLIGGEPADLLDTRGWYGFGRTWNASLKVNF